MQTTQSDINKVQVIMAAILVMVSEAKTASPLQGVPNGHIYANVMGELDFHVYSRLISFMKEKGLITESYHLLKTTPAGDKLAAQLREVIGM